MPVQIVVMFGMMKPSTREFVDGVVVHEDPNAINGILQWPHPLLSQSTQDLDIISMPLKPMNMIYKYMTALLMGTSNGIALAGNQAGFDLSIFVHRMYSHGGVRCVINPTYTVPPGVKKQRIEQPEGCLSHAGDLFRDDIERYPTIVASYWEFPSMIQVTNHKLNKLESQVFQHEIDHLNGITIISK